MLAVGCGAEPPARPNLLLVTLDTTRADRLGSYGGPAGLTPNLDRLAAEGLVYENAISPSSWTLPAHASLFTGKFTTSHGARYDADGPLILGAALGDDPEWDRYRARGLAPDARTLAELLRGAGYATAAVVAGPWLMRAIGLDRGFDVYDDDGIHSERGRSASAVTDRAIAWLRSRPDAPFFLFLNYFDPHGPFTPPPEFFTDLLPRDSAADPEDRARARTRALYDGEVRFMDHHFGRVLDALRDLDLYDDTWIVVTADHGELLGEHGLYGHGKTLHQELLHIPLLEKRPRGEDRRGRTDAPAQLVDMLPSVTRRLGLETPPGVQGTPLETSGHPIVAETYPLPFLEGARGDQRALFEGAYKLLWRSGGRTELYDLAGDPGERRSIAWREPERAADMERRLLGYLDSLPAPPPATGEAHSLDAETREALRGLGYLDAPAEPSSPGSSPSPSPSR